MSKIDVESKDQGAAVRGEAVALTEDEITDLMHKYTKFLGDGEHSVTEFDCAEDSYNFVRAVETEVLRRVSARAADALDHATPHQNTLDAITGAIAYGRQGTNPPPAPDHWLAEYWTIGQQLAELGKTSAWDNVTPIDSAPALDIQPTDEEPTERESLIACLGDDAATLSAANPDDEMAQTMREAAAMLESDEAVIATLGMASQPTVAAQQGSIADDARFRALLIEVLGAYDISGSDELGTGNALDQAVARFAQMIDSRASSAPVAPIAPDGWQPIETAPNVTGDYFFCSIAWGPEGDQSTGEGMRWNGRWFVAPVFHALGKERKFEHREIEVKPTHWRRSPPAPQQEGSEAGNG